MATDTPAYLRIAADLRAAITRGDIPAGTRIPTEAKLVAEYHVSTIAVRNAIAILKAEGLVDGRRGSGVYVRSVRRLIREAPSSNARAAPGPGSPFARDAARAGHHASWEHQSEHTTAGLEVARRLGLAPGEAVMRTRYLFYADDEPIQMALSYEPLSLTRGTAIEWPEKGEIIGVVNRFDRIGVHIDHCEERVKDRPARPEEIDLLRLLPRRAHVQTIERTYLAQGRAMETADIVFPVGRYEIVYRFPVD